MNALERIRFLRRKIISKLKNNQGDMDRLTRFATLLEQLEKAEEDTLKLQRLLDGIENQLEENHSLDLRGSLTSYTHIADKGAAVGRQRGSAQREKFISKIRTMGITLSMHSRRTVFKSNHGNVIGVSYASERSKNRWFLGAPVEDYDALVLLCEKENGTVEEIILPGELIKQRRENLESQNQLKFNVTLQDGSFYLLIPGGDREALDAYLSNYDQLLGEG